MIETISIHNRSVVSRTEKAGNITRESPVNACANRDIGSKMTDLLKGLQFSATKEDIQIMKLKPINENIVNEV
jgi:hypothetical protein